MLWTLGNVGCFQGDKKEPSSVDIHEWLEYMCCCDWPNEESQLYPGIWQDPHLIVIPDGWLLVERITLRLLL